MNAMSKAMFAAVLQLIVLSGCTGVNPFPLAARGGDTITLPVGSQDGMDKSNTTVSFTSDLDATPVDLTGNIRAIFNLYADKTSYSYSSTTQFNDDNFRYLHHEPWQTVIALDLPNGLQLGPGKVRVQTTVPQATNALEPGYTGTYPDLNTVDIGLEILPGTGSPTLFRYKTLFNGTLDSTLSDLEPGRQALVRPPVADPTNQWAATFGAIEFKVAVPMTDVSGTGIIDNTSVRLVTQDVSMFTDSNAHSSWYFDGSELTVMYISNTGQMYYYEPRFSVMAEKAEFNSVPMITSVRYFDVNGNEITGPAISDYSISLIGPSFL
jgi:hypothetical protein